MDEFDEIDEMLRTLLKSLGIILTNATITTSGDPDSNEGPNWISPVVVIPIPIAMGQGPLPARTSIHSDEHREVKICAGSYP